MHGDFGRTLPNLTTLLECDADILVLDVAVRVCDGSPLMPGHQHAVAARPGLSRHDGPITDALTCL